MTARFTKRCVLLAILACAASSQGAGLFGPPVADLKQGQFSLAVEYAHSESEFKASHTTTDVVIDGVKSDAFLTQPAFGISDDWEVYGILGVADMKMDSFDDGYQFAYGFGTKVTIDKLEKISWGFMFEVGYRDNKDNSTKDINGVGGFEGKVDYYDVTLAIGPSWQITDKVRLYGGPFLYLLSGHLNYGSEDASESFTLEQKNMIGGYFGAEYDLNKSTSWYGEYQRIGDGWLFGTGINWKF